MAEYQFALEPSTSQLRFTLRSARSIPKVMVRAKPTASTMSGTRVRSFVKIVSSLVGVVNLLVKIVSSLVKSVNLLVKSVNPFVKSVNPLVRIVATTVVRRSQGQAAGRTSLFNFWTDAVLLPCPSGPAFAPSVSATTGGLYAGGWAAPVRGS